MPDIATISTLLTSLNAATTMVKGLLALDKALDKAELKGKLVDVLESLAEARLTVTSLQDQLRELQAQLDMRAAMEFRAPGVYYQRREGKPDDGPFCQTCWDSAQKVIRLQPLHNGGMVCNICANVFGIPERERPGRADTDFNIFDR